MVREPFQQGDEVVVVVPERRAARHEADLVHTAQVCQRRLQPLCGGRVSDALPACQQAASELLLLVDHDHSRSGAPGLQRGGDAGRPRADHQDVAVGVHLVVPVRVGLSWRDP